MITSILLLAAPVVGTPPATPAKPDGDKIKCQVEYQANSRIPSRICLPMSEWKRIEDANRDDWASSRNARSSGRSGTIVDSPEGTISGYSVPGAKGPR